MSDIDSLQIKISADANKATNALNKLASSLTNFQRSLSIDTSKLTSISNSIQSIANAASSMNTSGIKNISTLTNSINRMGKIDTSGLSRISSALKTFSADMAGTKVDGVGDIASIASSISRLGGVASGRAITNIPLLAKNLKQLFTTLSTAPNVSENIIRMTNALAGLASTGAASGRAANSLGRNLNTYTASAKRATKSTFSLAAAFGKFYATYFLVIRGIKSLWKSIEGTTDYIEAFNYYTVAFNKVGKEWGKDFEKFGYDNAEDYAQSFGNRVNELLGKMSGLKVDVDGGLISESGMKNLGLNLQEITQYASQLASITNSLGQTGEVTTAISKSMTMLAGDISSLFNVDFSTVANNLQSGLIGQSRALYKYGIDITNATLQTYAYRYGIEKAVSEMSQAEKQQLRLLAILDQSKVSWGDLANTINSPSNMIRQFTNNVKEAGMVLGQLFIPVLQKVLPVINGVVIAIKRLLVSVASLLGIKIDFSSFGQGVSGYNEDLEDTADALDKVGKSAKKAKSYTLGIDELNIGDTNSGSSGSSSGGGAGIDLTKEIMDATAEYEKVWQEAFDKMQNTAMGWADKVSKVFKPVKDIIEDLSYAFKFDSDSWFKVAGMDTSKLVTGIFDWFTRAIDSVDWEKIGRHIGSFLDGMDWTAIFTSAGNFIETAIDAAIDLWKGSFDAAPIETTIITAIGLLKFTGVGNIIWGKISEKLSATVLGSSIGIVPTIAVAAVTWEIGFNVGKSLGEALFPDDKEIYENFSFFGEGGFFDTIKNTDFSILFDAWKQMNSDAADFLTKAMPIRQFFDFLSQFKLDINDTFGLVSVFENLKPIVENWFNESVKPWFSAERWSEFGENIKQSLSDKWNSFAQWWSGTGIPTWWNGSVTPWFTKEKWQNFGEIIKSSLKDKWTSFTSWWNGIGFAKWWNNVKSYFTTEKWTWSGIKDGLSNAWNNAIEAVKQIWNRFANWINDKLNFSWDPVVVLGKELVPGGSVNLGRIPTFETGGYVPSRYTMFMAGENGVPEIAGTVGGKTAVAGGVEITGIKDAINATAEAQMRMMQQEIDLLKQLLAKETSVNIGDRDIARASLRGQKAMGLQIIT
nr:MAG TPA: minor tail protein [Bacteriophage sp.]